ncbi:MAG TPA: filamentous hemagglutinin N-terminal domain-containing protein [Paracoccaceae bacterium]|nr:filamentous hemagglutinin N-terminal domain-containing protein [Paracoccaceae bacterium]
MSRAHAWLLILGSLLLPVVARSAAGEIKTDATLGRAPLALPGPDYAIGPELGRIKGQNLFQSFEAFSLDSGERATFSGPDGIRNIISRVTGGQPSDIDGTIRSTIAGADFYLINPAGIAFGPNASLDLQGSFHVTTADELRLADGTHFSARDPSPSSLTVAAPQAFGFLDRSAGSIALEGSNLTVAPDERVALVGGDVVMARASISLFDIARNGDVTLVAMSRSGAVAVADGRTSGAPNGEIRITGEGRPRNGAFSDGINLSSFGGGGAVRIRAGSLLVEGAEIRADNADDDPGGAMIDIQADRISITSPAIQGPSDRLSGSVLAADAFGNGRGGVINIGGGTIVVSDGAFISASTFGQGDAGAIRVEADRVLISSAGAEADEFTGILSDAGRDAIGRGGEVRISAADLELRDGGEIRSSTFGAGNAGAVDVNAARLFISGDRSRGLRQTGISSQVQAEALAADETTGAGGTLRVTAGVLELRADGKIRSITESRGNAGTVIVEADQVTLLGGGQISSTARGESTGQSGNVLLTASESISIFGQSDVFQGRVFPPSSVNASTESRRRDAGAGGTVTVSAPVIRLADRGEIASEVFGGGDGGAAEIRFVDLLEVDDAEITTKANTVNAGDIRISGQGVIDVRNDGQISSTVSQRESAGDAGDIDIRTGLLIVDAGRIQANGVRGQGGNIDIETDGLIRAPDGVIQALSALGVSGTVVTSTPEVDLSGGLVVLEGALLDAASQLRERCGARRDIGASSFTGVGRGGLPPSPDGPLAGAYASGFGAPGVALVPEERGGEVSAEEHSGERAIWPGVAGPAPCHGAL